MTDYLKDQPSYNLHKSIAYSMKDEQAQTRQKNNKILRVLRTHEKRLHRIEKHLKIIPSDKEILEMGADY